MNSEERMIQREEIAIIGMACHFPGAKNTEEFWQNLRGGVESIGRFTADESKASGIDQATLQDPSFVRAGALMDGADTFDAPFFGISAREAEVMDPQHRILLQTVWEALEHSGYDSQTYKEPIGIFGGVGQNTYLLNNLIRHPELFRLLGDHLVKIASGTHHAVTRVAYKLNLRGPSLSVNSACSTSGVAIHLACQSLLSGECDMALAGGGRIKVPLKGGYLYQEGGILSPDGHCRAFDSQAHGTVMGSGVGIIVLKRLSDAIRDGDTVHAIIKGTAINNDGAAKVGYTAPSMQGQSAVITEALAMADVQAETIQYIEAHGTGTAIGDPIEVAALTDAFRKSTSRNGFCAIGSVKTNIGHLDAGAGVAGVIKTVLALEHKELAPSLHFEKPNPQIDFDHSPFYVNAKLSAWPAGNRPRRAGVSSFGLGGTNAHMVLEEAPAIEASGESRQWQLVLLSAKTSDALQSISRHLRDHLGNNPELNLADIAYTLQVGRQRFGHRRVILCCDRDDALQALQNQESRNAVTHVSEVAHAQLAFMFTGQGSQYVNMGLGLYETEAVFRHHVDQCAQLLMTHLGIDLRSVLYPTDGQSAWAAEQLQQTAITQPALFVIEYALAALWMSWGLRPDAMIGHSIGEYVAACLSGVFSLEGVLELIATRGRLIQDLPSGAMLAVSKPETELKAFIGDEISLAAVNGPARCVLSGRKEAILGLERRFSREGTQCRVLKTSHAFHSAMMEAIHEPFADVVRKLHPSPPTIPFGSCVTGGWITEGQATDPSYWADHLIQTVRFSDGLDTLLQERDRILLEVGPGNSLTTLAMQHPRRNSAGSVISSLRHPKDQTPDAKHYLQSLGRLWLAGVDIDWSGFYRNERRHRIPLPPYPFEGKRYWIEISSEPPQALSIGCTKKGDPHNSSPSKNLHRESAKATRHFSPGNVPANKKSLVITEINQTIYDLIGLNPADIDVHATFLQLGFDSLSLTQLNSVIKKKYPIQLELRQLFESQSTPEALATFVADQPFMREWSMTTDRPGPGSTGELPSEATTKTPTELAASIIQTSTNAIERIIDQAVQAKTPLAALEEELRHQLEGIRQAITPWDGNNQRSVPTSLTRSFQHHLTEDITALRDQECKLQTSLSIKGIRAYPELEKALNQLCSSYIYSYLATSNIDMRTGADCIKETLRRRLCISPKFEKFFDYMLETLSQDQILKLGKHTIEFLKNPNTITPPRKLSERLAAKYPTFRGILELLEHCAQQYPRALSNETYAIRVLFPDGTHRFLDKTLSHDTSEYKTIRIYKLLTKEFLLRMSRRNPLKVLEVGAGNGSLTWQIIPKLEVGNIEYHFSDIGRSFVVRGQKEAQKRNLRCMKFGVLDISKDPLTQGYEHHSFDIILGHNVVHATRNLTETIQQMTKLLVPNGLVCLIETVKAHRWDTLVWGLAEGWWYFNDAYRRSGPLLGLDQWEQVLRDEGFKEVYTLPSDPTTRLDTDAGLIIAQSMGTEKQVEAPSGSPSGPIPLAEITDVLPEIERLSEEEARELLQKERNENNA